jgi:hypothetical protein
VKAIMAIDMHKYMIPLDFFRIKILKLWRELDVDREGQGNPCDLIHKGFLSCVNNY